MSGLTQRSKANTLLAFAVQSVVAVVLALALAPAIATDPQSSSLDTPQAQQGRINLNHKVWSSIPLIGEWGFHWGVLLNAQQWQDPSPPFFSMPSTWDEDGHAGHFYPGQGAATFTLVIENVPSNLVWSMLIPEITTSYLLIVNGETLSQGGQVALSQEDFVPYYGNRLVTLPAPVNGQYQVQLQVANFAHYNGGPWQAITLRPANQALDREDRQSVIEAVVSTLLLLMAALLVLEYFIDPRDRTGFWLGLLSLDLGIRLGIQGSGSLYWLWDFQLPWAVHITVLYVTMVCAPVLLFGWYRAIFEGDFSDQIFRLSILPYLLATLFVIVAPPIVFTAWLKFFSFILLLAMVVAVWYLILVVMRKRRNAWLLLLGVGVLCVSTVHDMMVNNQMISGSRWLHLGFLVFVLSQVMNFLSLRVWQRRQIEVLSHKLQKTNTELERRVQLRTQDLSEKAEQLSVANEQLKVLANIDGLTGILNRRAFIERLEGAPHYTKPYVVILIDLDYFKQVNDTHGHGAGDEVLKLTGQLLDKLRRAQDAVGRIGGEEFAVLLTDCDEQGARSFVSRFQQGLLSLDLSAWPDLNPITASIGVALSGVRPATGSAMLHAADEAMYAVKKNGRNGFHIVQVP